VFEENFLEARILVLHSGHDPDSFISEFGCEAFIKAANEAFEVISFLIDCAEKERGLSVRGKIRIISDMKKPLAAMKDNVARSFYIRHLSERLKIDESVILEALREESSKTASEKNREDNAQKQNRAGLNNVSGKGGTLAKLSRIELKILAMMLQSPGICSEIKKRNIIDFFDDETLKFIGRLILKYHEDPDIKPSDIMTRVKGDRQRQVFASIAIKEESWTRAVALDLLAQFEAGRRSRGSDVLSQEIRAAEKADEHERLIELLKKKQARAATVGAK